MMACLQAFEVFKLAFGKLHHWPFIPILNLSTAASQVPEVRNMVDTISIQFTKAANIFTLHAHAQQGLRDRSWCLYNIYIYIYNF